MLRYATHGLSWTNRDLSFLDGVCWIGMILLQEHSLIDYLRKYPEIIIFSIDTQIVVAISNRTLISYLSDGSTDIYLLGTSKK